METRSFELLTKLTATEEQWKELDRIVEAASSFDEVSFVCVSKIDTEDDILCSVYMPIIVLKDTVKGPSDALYESLKDTFQRTFEYITESNLTNRIISLY